MPRLWSDPGRFGIRARLLTLLLPGILGLLVLDSWNDHRALKSLVQKAYDQSMEDSVNLLRSGLSLGPDGTLQLNTPLGTQAAFDANNPLHKYVYVGLAPQRRASNQPLAQDRTLLGEADLPSPPPSTAGADPSLTWFETHHRGQSVRIVAYQSSVVDGLGQAFDLRIRVAENSGPRDQAQATSMQDALIRDVRTVLVVVLLVWLGVTWCLYPLERLRRSVQQNQGQDLQPLDTRGVPHEVAPLVEAVNQHIASYRNLLEQQSQFLADASHQLRTPLAIMLTQAGVALREKDPHQLRQTLRALITQITRSKRLCEQLLSLAQAGGSTLLVDAPAVVDLNTLAKDVVLQYLSLAHEKNQDLGWVDARSAAAGASMAGLAAAPVVGVSGYGAELHEALANLLHNAIVYTPAGGRITVQARVDGASAVLEVRDDGPGIAPARRAEAFARFRHTGARPGADARGAGLGLAIARAYARRSGGDIELSDVDGGSGLCAVLRLPVLPHSQN